MEACTGPTGATPTHLSETGFRSFPESVCHTQQVLHIYNAVCSTESVILHFCEYMLARLARNQFLNPSKDK